MYTMVSILKRGNVGWKRLPEIPDRNIAYLHWRTAELSFRAGLRHYEEIKLEKSLDDFAISYHLCVFLRNLALHKDSPVSKSDVDAIHKKIYNSAMFYGKIEFDYNTRKKRYVIDILDDLEQLQEDCSYEIASLNNKDYLKWFNEWIQEGKRNVEEYFRAEDPEAYRLYKKIKCIQQGLKEEIKKEEYEKAAKSRDKNEGLFGLLIERGHVTFVPGEHPKEKTKDLSMPKPKN